MKTAAAALLYLGLGCAAAGLPGDAAAGQPLEKRLERARRLSADACATETTTFSTCLADASITFTPATPAGPWASCADVQAEVAGICAAGPTACEVEYHTYTECLYEYMLTSSYGASCDLTCASSTRTPAPTPADFQDLDGDGANLCGNQNLRRVRAESSHRPPRHRRDACSMAWRCRFLAARPSQDGRVIAEK